MRASAELAFVPEALTGQSEKHTEVEVDDIGAFDVQAVRTAPQEGHAEAIEIELTAEQIDELLSRPLGQ